MTSRCDYTMIPFAQTIIDAKITCAAPYDTDHYAIWVTIPVTDMATHKNIKKRWTTVPMIEPTNNAE